MWAVPGRLVPGPSCPVTSCLKVRTCWAPGWTRTSAGTPAKHRQVVRPRSVSPLTFPPLSVASSQNVQSESAPGQATPTDVTPPGSSGCSVNGKETVPTNQKQDVVQSPAAPAPTDPPLCDIIASATSSEVGGAITPADPGREAWLCSSVRGGAVCSRLQDHPAVLLQVSAPRMHRRRCSSVSGSPVS